MLFITFLRLFNSELEIITVGTDDDKLRAN